MNILAMRVDESRGDGGQPGLYAIIEDAPKLDDIVHTMHEFGGRLSPKSVTVYAGLKDGFANFYVHDAADESGYGGSKFELNIKTDSGIERRTIKGPWSGRPSVMEMCGYEPCMEITYRRVEEFDLEQIYNEALVRLNKLRDAGPRISIADYKLDTSAPDVIPIGHVDMRAYYQGVAASQAHYEIGRSFYKVLTDPNAHGGQIGPRTMVPWTDTPMQRALALELALWDRGLWTAGSVTVRVIQEAMERLTPGFTLYRKRIARDEIWMVPARKQRVGSMFGDDTPAPKEEGFWGYAIHDGQGYPVSKFYSSIDALLKQFPNIDQLDEVQPAWKIAKRDKGQWEGLSPAERMKLPRQLRDRRAA